MTAKLHPIKAVKYNYTFEVWVEGTSEEGRERGGTW